MNVAVQVATMNAANTARMCAANAAKRASGRGTYEVEPSLSDWLCFAAAALFTVGSILFILWEVAQ